MRSTKPTDDPFVQAIMASMYNALCELSKDKASIPPLAEVRDQVDKFVLCLSREPHLQPATLLKRYKAIDWAKAVVGLLYCHKYKKRMPTRSTN